MKEDDEVIIGDYQIPGNDLHFRLIENDDGYYMDIRRITIQGPSRFNYRVTAIDFERVVDAFKEDVKLLKHEFDSNPPLIPVVPDKPK